jgi:hypothetical protein
MVIEMDYFTLGRLYPRVLTMPDELSRRPPIAKGW